MAFTTQADVNAGSGTQAVALSPGMMLPVQALTTGFVHEALPLPLHATQMPPAGQAAVQRLLPQAADSASGQAGQGAVAAWGLLGEMAPGAAQTQAAEFASSVEQATLSAFATAAAVAPASAQPAVEVAAMPVAGMAQLGPAVFAPGAVADDMRSRQGVRIGSVGVMLTYEDSSELTDMPELYYLPNAPAWIIGLANLHGNFVPVFDLAAYLGIEKNRAPSASQSVDTDKSMLLVLGHGAEAAGIIIDGIPQRLVPLHQQQTDTDTAPALLMPHIREAYFLNGQLWFDLDCRSLLSALEQAVIDYAQV